jgi:hypothetical protein
MVEGSARPGVSRVDGEVRTEVRRSPARLGLDRVDAAMYQNEREGVQKMRMGMRKPW